MGDGQDLPYLRPQMSFVFASALKSVDFRRLQYGPLTNIINTVSAGPKAWDILVAIWSLRMCYSL